MDEEVAPEGTGRICAQASMILSDRASHRIRERLKLSRADGSGELAACSRRRLSAFRQTKRRVPTWGVSPSRIAASRIEELAALVLVMPSQNARAVSTRSIHAALTLKIVNQPLNIPSSSRVG